MAKYALNTKHNSITGRGLSSLKKNFSGWVLVLPSVLCVCMFVLWPQVLGVIYSFFSMKGFQIEKFVGLDNYIRLMTDTVFMKAFINTWMYVFWSLIIGFIVPFAIAIVMNELLHFRRLTRTIVYLPSIMPTVAVSLLWFYMYYPDSSGLLNMILEKLGMEPYIWLQDSRFTIIYIIISMTWSGMGSTAIYYFAGLQGVNRELYEAAMLDGAGFFRRIVTVTMPQMSGILILFLMRQIIGVFNIIDQPLQMTSGGPNNASISMALLNYRYGFVMHRPQLALAGGVVMFLVLIVFTFIYFWVDKRIQENQM